MPFVSGRSPRFVTDPPPPVEFGTLSASETSPARLGQLAGLNPLHAVGPGKLHRGTQELDTISGHVTKWFFES